MMDTTKHIVLIVEDDPVLRLLARKQLALLGYECECVTTGEEAVLRAQAGVSLVFMDIGLPGMDGIAAAMLIRENESKAARGRTPIVALTAHSQRELCMTAGMDDFLQKPALLPDMKRILQKWLS